MGKIISLFDDLLEKISRWGITLSLSLILGFSLISIVQRWAGSSSLWIDPLIRHLVFLSAFLGGSLATSKRVHIKIDLCTHFVNASNSKILKWVHANLISLFCLITTIVLLKAGIDLYLMEKEFGTVSFLNIHSSYLVGIIPFGVGLISLRFLNQFLLGLLGGEAHADNRL